jgi:hypothetical protein
MFRKYVKRVKQFLRAVCRTAHQRHRLHPTVLFATPVHVALVALGTSAATRTNDCYGLIELNCNSKKSFTLHTCLQYRIYGLCPAIQPRFLYPTLDLLMYTTWTAAIVNIIRFDHFISAIQLAAHQVCSAPRFDHINLKHPCRHTARDALSAILPAQRSWSCHLFPFH